MKQRFSDFYRQTEMIALVISGISYSKSEFAEYFECAEITINRDLKELRENGIQIFSQKGKVLLKEPVSITVLCKITADYLALKMESHNIINSVRPSSVNDSILFLSRLTILSKAVSEQTIVDIKYRPFYDNQTKSYTILPLRLFQSGYNWILEAVKKEEDIIKAFYLSRILEIRLRQERFESKQFPEVDEKAVQIILKFIPAVEAEITDKIWFEKFEIKKDETGNIILTTELPITNKLAAWCISWWDSIKIIQPPELLAYIQEMYNDFASSNKIS